MSMLHQIEAIKDLLQESVDRGSTLVENIHRLIEGTLIETTGIEENPVVQAHQERVRKIYEAIRGINKQVGDAASEVFAVLEEQVEIDQILKDKKGPLN